MPPKRRLSETSEASGAGAEDDASVGGLEEEEKVTKPGRPKKKKVDPTQQFQVNNFESLLLVLASISMFFTNFPDRLRLSAEVQEGGWL